MTFSVHPGIYWIFGTLDEFDTLVAAAHASNLKVILDLVLIDIPINIPGLLKVEAHAITESAIGISAASPGAERSCPK